MVPAGSRRIPPAPRYSGILSRRLSISLTGLSPPLAWRSSQFCYRLTYTLLSTLQPRCQIDTGLDSSPFARHYSGNHYCFLFLRVLRCFTSPGLPTLRCNGTWLPLGCPIQISTDQCLLPTPRSVSPVAASFFASVCQGILQLLLISYRKFNRYAYFIRFIYTV